MAKNKELTKKQINKIVKECKRKEQEKASKWAKRFAKPQIRTNTEGKTIIIQYGLIYGERK